MNFISLLKILCIFSFLCLKNSWATVTPSTESSASSFYLNKSYYSMDKELSKKGYSMQASEGQILYFYEGRLISPSEFIGPLSKNKAAKLFIFLEDTIKNSNIYLNEIFQEKTNSKGSALIDKFYPQGNYLLKIEDKRNETSMNYLLTLDKDMKLSCSGTKKLICRKTYY